MTLPGDQECMQLLHMVRMELLAKEKLDALSKMSLKLEHTSQSMSQLLVDHILDSKELQGPVQLEKNGYSSASQNEEDGILAEVFRRIGIISKTFFEFGVGNGLQNNTLHFLL